MTGVQTCALPIYSICFSASSFICSNFSFITSFLSFFFPVQPIRKASSSPARCAGRPSAFSDIFHLETHVHKKSPASACRGRINSAVPHKFLPVSRHLSLAENNALLTPLSPLAISNFLYFRVGFLTCQVFWPLYLSFLFPTKN